jgi:hypothetical protein
MYQRGTQLIVAIRTPQNPYVRSGIRSEVAVLITESFCLFLFDNNA